jgi:hypothetical protein
MSLSVFSTYSNSSAKHEQDYKSFRRFQKTSIKNLEGNSFFYTKSKAFVYIEVFASVFLNVISTNTLETDARVIQLQA